MRLFARKNKQETPKKKLVRELLESKKNLEKVMIYYNLPGFPMVFIDTEGRDFESFRNYLGSYFDGSKIGFCRLKKIDEKNNYLIEDRCEIFNISCLQTTELFELAKSLEKLSVRAKKEIAQYQEGINLSESRLNAIRSLSNNHPFQSEINQLVLAKQKILSLPQSERTQYNLNRIEHLLNAFNNPEIVKLLQTDSSSLNVETAELLINSAAATLRAIEGLNENAEFIRENWGPAVTGLEKQG